MTGEAKSEIPINWQEALERVGGDEAFLQDLLNIYSEEFEKKFAELKLAVEGKDFRTIREAGHYLKGASANLSLPALREASWKMEKAGTNSDLEAAREALSLLKKEFQRLQEFLKTGS